MNQPTSTRRPIENALISVVLPLYNESDVLERLHERTARALKQHGTDYELIFVNDGSTDASGDVLDRLAEVHATVRVLHFSRNFGHQAAVQAGLDAAQGDAVIVMDTDLQDDPASLPKFIDKWLEGHDVVFAVRTKRKERLLKRGLFFTFYRFLNMITETPIPNDAGNFGLIDRQVAQSIGQLPESDRFFPGLRQWVGYKQVGIQVERLARHDDQPRVSLRGLFRLAKTAIFSFSSAPLTMFYVIALLSCAVCVGFSMWTLYNKAIGLAIPGWTSTIMIASFFGAINALGIGILGEYVVRIYDQVRGRPQYIVARESGHSQPLEIDTVTESVADVVRAMQDDTRRAMNSKPASAHATICE